MSQIDTIVDGLGIERRLGTLVPPAKVSAMPSFEKAVKPLSDGDILAVARSGIADGRRKFDKSFIKNQRSHGSCNGYAGAGALTRARIRRGLERVDLSGAFLYSLINNGRDQGSALEDGMREMQRVGIATEATVNWDQIYPGRYDQAKATAEAARYRGWECYAVGTREGLFTAAALGWDVVVAVHVGNGFMTLDSNGFPGASNGPGNHAVGADGLIEINGKPVLTAFNSWDVDYGHDGRMLLDWNSHLAQPSNYHMFYAIRSTGDDALAVNPPVAA